MFWSLVVSKVNTYVLWIFILIKDKYFEIDFVQVVGQEVGFFGGRNGNNCHTCKFKIFYF